MLCESSKSAQADIIIPHMQALFLSNNTLGDPDYDIGITIITEP